MRSLGNSLFQAIENALSIDYEDLDIIVVDNGSSDGSADAIENRFDSDVILIRLSRNYGYAGGNEIGLRKYLAMRGFPDYLVVMNNDFIVKDSSVIKRVLRYIDTRRDIVIAQGITLQVNERRIESMGILLDTMLQHRYRCQGLRLDECPEKISYVSYALGNFMLVKLKPVLKIRGYLFKREFFILWEETELSLNMWTHGLKTVAVPEITGVHLGSQTLKRVMPLAWYAWGRNKYIVYRKILSPYLRSRYFNMPIILEIANMYRRIIQGEKGRSISRGFIDGFIKGELTKTIRGSYEPLLIMPKGEQAVNYLLIYPLSQELAMEYSYLTKLSTLVIDDEKLRSSPRPFLVKI